MTFLVGVKRMDPESFEQFFIGYLEENRLDYSLKGGVYTVKLDKKHKKMYELDKCTFDPLLAKNSIQLLQPGNFVFDNIVTAYKELVISNLKIIKKNSNLMELNERLGELKKLGVPYKITEKQGVGEYIFFEINVKTANRKRIFLLPLLIFDDKVFSADKFVNAEFRLVKEGFKVKSVKEALLQINRFIGKDLAKAEKEQNKDMGELLEIQRQHAEEQYKELKLQEDKILNRVEELNEKSLNASSFLSRDKYIHQAKSLKKKHLVLVKKNSEKREEIKKLFDKQIEELQTRELNVEANILALAKLDFPYFLIEFTDGDQFYYFGFLEKFEKKNP